VRGSTPMAAVLAWFFRFPVAARDVPVSLLVEPDGDGERWTRVFDGRTFRSRLRPGRSRGEIEERFGPIAFRIAVTGNASGLQMQVLGWRLGPLPLPRRLAARSDARETQDARGRFHFDVPIDLPLGLGRIVHYTGWLQCPD
jgi:hypothetical protein